MNKKAIVVKIGGSTLGANDTTTEDLAKLQNEGFKLVVVHGGAKTVNDWLTRLKIPTTFVKGLRVTDLESLKVVTAVLAGLVNKEIVSEIWKASGKAIGISGVDGHILKARNLDPELGYTGQELFIDINLIATLLDNGYLPVIAPICLNSDININSGSNLINVNGDTVAAEIAAVIEAEKLIFLTDVPGLYDSSNKLINFIDSNEANELIINGVISGGMVVKIGACIDALSKVAITRIIDGRVPHALMKEVTGKGNGTTITSNKK